MYKKSLSYTHLIWMMLFVLAPMFLIFIYAFTHSDTQGNIGFTLSNFSKFFEPIYIKILLNSIWIAFISVIFCLIFGYPVAMILANKDRRREAMGKKPSGLLMLFVLPMWMNVMLRLYAWLTVLQPDGLLNVFLSALGLPKLDIMYTYSAVVLGTVYDFIPFMIMPIYSVLIKIDGSVIEAAQDLGANKFKVFFKVILPLSMPGVVSGITMVFLPALTSFYISDFFSGGQFMLIGNLIEKNFKNPVGRNFGSAVSLILMAFAFLSMHIMKIFNKTNRQMEMF
ncbi:MAG: ABC transporter permease [Clostridia bacterium]|nr:ABC transporter permease [Clostridia bacterium]